MTFQWFLNPLLDIVPILYPLKTQENFRFPGVFRVYKTEALFISGFSTDSYKTLNKNCKSMFCWSPVYLATCTCKKSLENKVKRNFVNFITLRRYLFSKKNVPILLQIFSSGWSRPFFLVIRGSSGSRLWHNRKCFTHSPEEMFHRRVVLKQWQLQNL